MRRTKLAILFFISVLGTLPLFASASDVGLVAQSSSAGDPEINDDDLTSPEVVREMVSRLSDAQVRTILLDRLDAVAQQKQIEDARSINPVDVIKLSALGVFDSLRVAILRLPVLFEGQARSFRNFFNSRGGSGVLQFFSLIVVAILTGLLVEWVIGLCAKRWRNQIANVSEPKNLNEALRTLGLRLLLDVIGLLAFFIVIKIVVSQWATEQDEVIASTVLVSFVLVPRLIAALSRFLLAPHRPELRLVHTDDRSARFIHRHQIGLAILMGLNIGLIQFNSLNGIVPGELRLGFWLNTGIHIYLGIIIWRARAGLIMMMSGRSNDITALEAKAARFYPIYGLLVTSGLWILVEVLVSQGKVALIAGGVHYWTLLIMIMVPAMDTLIRGLVKHLAPPMTGEGRIAEEAYRSTKRSYIRIGRTVMFGLVLYLIAKLWGIEFHNIASAGIGARAAAGLVEIMIIFATGYLIWEIVTVWINRKLAAEYTAAGIDPDDEELGGEGGAGGASRLSTVLPLLRLVLQSTVVVMTVLIGLGNIGIDVTPLLAGAGIIGLAIGFGAQKLVTDVVSGVFFLIDDAFRAGEFVEVEGTMGVIEKISLRALQLRHHLGAVHTIPYGEIPKISNFSRDWVMMKLRFTVPFDSDINKIKKLFKKIGADLMQVPEYQEDILQPFKSQGVLEVDDVGMVIRGKIMTKPGKQFTLRKEIYQRVQKAFDENGLQFARKEVRVKIDGPADAQLGEAEREAIAAAASDAAEKPGLPTARKKDML
ncbi:MAG: mechanosensitive ion channel domain-containing protein [Pseudomonadota bacterium]